MVLALTSPAEKPLCERLLIALAQCCAAQGGRVLVIERGTLKAESAERGTLQAAPDELDGFPGELMRGAQGILYADLKNAQPSDMYLALDVVTGAPARFNLVLLNVQGDAPEDLFMASLAQRVVVVASAGQAALSMISGLIETIAVQHQQRHFTLAIDAALPQARSLYRQLLYDPALSQVACELLEMLPAAVTQKELPLEDFASSAEGVALLNAFRQEALSLSPSGGLQLFWRSVLFCSACSLKLCREVLSSGQRLEVCPAQRF